MIEVYCVYENYRAEDKAVVHKSSCAHCNGGKGIGTNTKGIANGRWYTGFSTEDKALIFAKGLNRKNTKKCGHCCK